MKVSIYLGPDEIKEAVLEYLQKHRGDFIDERFGGTPAMTFQRNGEELDVVAIRVDQQLPVHTGQNPYR